MAKIEKVKTTCRSCHGGCGVILTLENDRVVKVQPDPDSPLNQGRICPKGLAAIEILYHPDRLQYPMKRVGKRGEGKWQRISWDEAYDLLAENIRSLEQKYGMESIAVMHGTGRHHHRHIRRFANVLGTPNCVSAGHCICFGPRVLASQFTYGTFPVVDYYGKTKPACILIWGANPAVSGADCELQYHIKDAVKSGTKLIVIDPIPNELTRKADLWLRIRPGTDGALALAILNILISENLYDRQFAEQWTYGFSELKERCAAYDPKTVADITWIPEEQIYTAARMIAAAKPLSLEWGCALEHTPNCFQTVRAVGMIPAITGNFDVPGGFIEGMDALPGIDILRDRLPHKQREKCLGSEEFPFLAGNANMNPSSHPPLTLEAMLSGKPYPVKAALIFGNNSLISLPNSQKVYQALQNLDFISCMDLFLTPTAAMADLVLPAASWMELDEVYGGPYRAEHVVLCQKKVVRTGECKADEEVFLELCRRLGYDYQAETVYDILNRQLEEIGNRHPAYAGLDFEKLKEINFINIPIEYFKYKQRGGFKTPTGKLELYSTILAKAGVNPLPFYREIPESPYSRPDLAKEYPLVLTTGRRSQQFFISEHRQIPSLRRKEPFPRAMMHPSTAAQYGINDGDWVYIETPRGRITQKALLEEGMDPRVINCQMGWWYPEAGGPNYGWAESNCNILTNSDPPYDPVYGSYQLRGLLCKISKNFDRSIEERFHNCALFKKAEGE